MVGILVLRVHPLKFIYMVQHMITSLRIYPVLLDIKIYYFPFMARYIIAARFIFSLSARRAT